MRIVSLVPSATEMLFALGLGDQVVAVTHECDFPPETASLPHVTLDELPADLSSAEIDAAVRERTERGEAIYSLDRDLLAEIGPDLIVTQALCPVCAVSYDDVVEIAEELTTKPDVISLDPKTLGEVLGDIRTLAEATDSRDEGVDLIQSLADRIDRVKLAVRSAQRPTVAAIEWFDPPYVAGHWTPQLIEYAGGIDVLGLPGEHSERVEWEELAATSPEIVVAMPCGYDKEIASREAEMFSEKLSKLGAKKIVAVDASAYFSRPGPRLVDGLELLAHIFHPDLTDPPSTTAIDVPV